MSSGRRKSRPGHTSGQIQEKDAMNKLEDSVRSRNWQEVEQLLLHHLGVSIGADHSVAENRHASGIVCKSTVDFVVEKAVEGEAWSFLVRLLALDSVGVGQMVFSCLFQSLTQEQMVGKVLDTLYKDADLKDRLAVCTSVLKSLFASAAVLSEICTPVKFVTDLIGRLCPGSAEELYVFWSGGFTEIKKLFDCTKPVLDVHWDKEQKHCLLEALTGDNREGCSYYAVLLAFHLEHWHHVVEILKKKASPAVPTIFLQSFEKGAWETAATILHNKLLEGTPRLVERIYRDQTCLKGKELDGFLDTCIRCGLYSAGAVVAYCAGRFSMVEKLLSLEESRSLACSVFMEIQGKKQSVMICVSGRLPPWRLLCDLTKLPLLVHLAGSVLEGATRNCSKPESRTAIRHLFGKCHSKTSLTFVVINVMRGGHSELFCKLVAKDHIDLSSIRTEPHGETLMSSFAVQLAREESHALRLRFASSEQRREKVRKMYIILRKCIEMGLSTQQPFIPPVTEVNVGNTVYRHRPIHQMKQGLAYRVAAEGNLRILQILYETGVVSNAELYHLASDPNMRQMLQECSYSDVLGYLDTVAGTPRSLEDMCKFVVSRQIGCRGNRKQRALSLDLPKHLVYKLLFCDVLY